MNAGRPVVASDHVGACLDLVKDTINGYVYRAGDVEGLRAALTRLITNPELRQRMGDASLDIISQWGFEEDVRALKKALDPQRFKTRRTVREVAPKTGGVQTD